MHFIPAESWRSIDGECTGLLPALGGALVLVTRPHLVLRHPASFQDRGILIGGLVIVRFLKAASVSQELRVFYCFVSIFRSPSSFKCLPRHSTVSPKMPAAQIPTLHAE